MLNLTEGQMNAVRRYYGLRMIGDARPEGNTPNGVSAMYLGIDEKHGVKFYTNRQTMLQSYHWSRILHRMGMSPAVWDMGSITLLNGDMYNSETLHYFHQQRVTVVKSVVNYDYNGNENRLSKLVNKAHRRFIQKHGIRNNDGHFGNWGFLGAKLVMIDVADLAYIWTGNEYDYEQRVYLY